MRWKTTLVLLLVTIGVGAYISLYEIRQPSREEREQRASRILSIPAGQVTQLTLSLPKADVTLNRHGEAWRLSPAGVRADAGRISQLLSHLDPLRAERTLSGSPERPLDPKAFGLDPAVGSLTLTANGVPTTIVFGETTPVQHNRYLKVSGRAEIFVVSSELFNDANQPAESFRDTALVHVNAWTVEEFRLTSPSASLSLSRRDQDWLLTSPLEDRADRAAVQAVLNALGNLRIARFVNDAPEVEQLATWGLDQPMAEVSLRQRDETAASVTLFFGKPLSDEPSLIYAKRSDEVPLYAVAKSDVEALLKPPADLRSKTCVEFFTSSVSKVEATTGGSAWTIERTDLAAPTQEESGPQWRVSGSDTALDAQRVEEFLNKLSDMRLIEFVDEAPLDLGRYGLQSPSGAIAVWTIGRESPQRLLIGNSIEGSTNRYGHIEGRNPIVSLPELVTELLATTPDQLRPAPTPPDTTSEK